MTLGSFEVDGEVAANTLAALGVFRSLGASVEEVDLGWGPDAFDAGMTYLEHLFGGYLSNLLADHADEMTAARALSAQIDSV